MISEESIERVRESADAVSIIGEYVDLKRQGSSYRGPCPFHQGTDRNFSVSPKTGYYYCFVCKEKGDVFKFLMSRLGLDWPSVVRLVAEKSGVQIVETHNPREQQERDTREPFWEVNSAAAEYFKRVLWEEEIGAAAREYLASREIDRALAEHAGVGFAPREIGLLRNYLNTLGYENDRLIEAGLLVVPDEGTEPRPRFRNRLIFPIYDVQSRVVGFGGRLLGPGEPKYLNSAESPVFSKGKLLYALNWAKQAARRDERMLVVEGYFDVLRLMGAGIECVVAPMGTALTEDQAKLVRKYTDRVYLLYDSDKAGLQATFRSGDELLRQGAAVQVVTLPDGEDPDTFVRAHGARGLEAQISSSIDVFERKIQLLERGGWFSDLRRKRQALDRLIPTLRAASDPITRELYKSHLERISGVSGEVLEREIQEAARRSSRQARFVPKAVREAEARASKDEHASVLAAPAKAARMWPPERELVRILIHRPELVDQAGEWLGTDDFQDLAMRSLYSAILAGSAEPTALAEAVEGDALVMLQELLNESGGLEAAARTLSGMHQLVQEIALREEIAELQSQFEIAQGVEKTNLLEQITRKGAERRAMRGRGWNVGTRSAGVDDTRKRN